MTVLSYQSILQRCADDNLIEPWTTKEVVNGKSYGLSQCGYDVRIKLPDIYQKTYMLLNPGKFVLASTYERIKMPNDLVAIVHDKSSWARIGIAVQNTVLEPGWEGWVTLELTNHSSDVVRIDDGDPIAQFMFHLLDQPTAMPYKGKYQNQEDRPVEARYESTPK